MAVIAVFNQKGGVGKTTTCLNVSAALACLERRPLAIDLDPQAHLTLSFGLRDESREGGTIADFYRSEKPLVGLVRDLANGMRLIPGHMELSKIDALYGNSTSIVSRLRDGLQESLAWEDSPILIDCCPMLGVLSLNAIFAADRVLIPVSADFLSMQGVERLDAALSVLEKALKRSIERKVVLTRFDSRRKFSHQVYAMLKERYGDSLCETRITENVSLAESPSHGKSVFDFAPHSQGAKDYLALTAELLEKNFIQ
ncbi:MAG: ParA family protein [Betaproteobacteria bacterium]